MQPCAKPSLMLAVQYIYGLYGLYRIQLTFITCLDIYTLYIYKYAPNLPDVFPTPQGPRPIQYQHHGVYCYHPPAP